MSDDTVFDIPEFVKGADLRYQGELDAEQAIKYGIIVFIPKWGEGDYEVDTFKTYSDDVVAAGGLLTWYQFPSFGAKSGSGYTGGYDPAIDGRNEGQAFLAGIAPYPAPDLPLMVDIEKEKIDISDGDAQVWMRAFCGVVRPESPKQRVLLYSSDRKLREIFGEYADGTDFYEWLVSFCDLLLPRYGLNEPGDAEPDFEQYEPTVPQPWADAGLSWVGWQYSSKFDADAPAGKQPGEVDGIEKEADMCLFRTSWLRTIVPASEIAELVARGQNG